MIIDTPLRISDEAFSYLIHQRGALWDLRDDRAAWEAAYARDLARTYHAMAPWLPKVPVDSERPSVLDIGAGMGGIDLLLWRHYGERGVYALVDALDDQAQPERHAKAFGSGKASRRFLEDNGLCREDVISIAPDGTATTGPFRGWGIRASGPPKADLVISLRAWCFHFPPEDYLDRALAHAAPDATFILDVRRVRLVWLSTLIARLGRPEKIGRSEKSDLLVFRAS